MFGLVNQSSNPIYTLEIPGRTGVVGMTPCPGIRLESAKRGNPQKTLKRDIAALHEWGATGVVTLNETDELYDLGLPNLGEELQMAGFWWRHLPIVDMNVPVPSFEESWRVEGQQISASLAAGEKVVIHCLAGLGRTGMIAARLLVDMGVPAETAIADVRRVRPRAIQTNAQEDYVREHGKKSRHDRWSRLQGRQGSAFSKPAANKPPMKGFGT
jgi:ADP-ribosyl-[dinitrogen reductase] hydrolase